jgi:ADP-heptose:LPS heptosyltransferase
MNNKIAIFPFAANNGNFTGENPKNWPYWKELVRYLEAKGYECHQFCASEQEEFCTTVHRNTPLSKLHAKISKEYLTFISVDSFYQHMNDCHSKQKGVVIFTVSDPEIYGHPYNENILKSKSYLRRNQYLIYGQGDLNTKAYPTLDKVAKAVIRVCSE